MVSGGGRFALGCIFSAVGAGVGAAIWGAIAYKSQYEVGWVAWGLGGLAGLGMLIGFRTASLIGGVVAAGLSVLSIVAAKFVVFGLLLDTLVGQMLAPAGTPREDLVNLMAFKAAREDPATESAHKETADEMYARELEKAEPIVAALSDDEVARRITVLNAEARAFFRTGMNRQFFQIMFSWKDVIFIGLALATAFKIGSMAPPGS
jgi:hypothetical protein